MAWEKSKNIIYFLLNTLSFLARAVFRSPRISILMYHSIGDNQVLFTVTAADFATQLAFLKQKGYAVVALSELVGSLKAGKKITDKTIVLTFDDGYQDNYFNAWPILKRYNFPATIFVSTDYLGKQMNNSQGIPIPVLNRVQIREMAESGLIEFGSHAHTHPRLNQISDREFADEVAVSKKILEEITGRPCRFFAYPKGYFKPAFVEILASFGFEAALTVKDGLVKTSQNKYSLPRNFIYSTCGFAQFKGKLNYSVEIFNSIKHFLMK